MQFIHFFCREMGSSIYFWGWRAVSLATVGGVGGKPKKMMQYIGFYFARCRVALQVWKHGAPLRVADDRRRGGKVKQL